MQLALLQTGLSREQMMAPDVAAVEVTLEFPELYEEAIGRDVHSSMCQLILSRFCHGHRQTNANQHIPQEVLILS